MSELEKVSYTQKECKLTTVDNPFDPFDNSDNWLQFDQDRGYYSNEKAVRNANFTSEMTEQEMNEEMERAIDEFIACDFLDLYKKVEKNVTIEAYVENIEE